MRVIYSNGLGVERAGAERTTCVKDFIGEQGSLLICSFLPRAGTLLGPREATAAERSRAEMELLLREREKSPKPLTTC